MVSLSNDRTHSGGYFGFSDDCAIINATNTDDDLIVDHIELVSEPEMTHKAIKTSWAIIFAKFIYIALGVSAYILPLQCDSHERCGEEPLSLIIYIHGGIWFILLCLDRYFQCKHDESRMNGYLKFYRETRNIRRLPVVINSCANAILVIMLKVLDGHCGTKGNCKFLTKILYVQILVSIEVVAALVSLLIYLVHTWKFNRKRALPDVTQAEVNASFVNSHSSSDLGFRSDTYNDHVMEKQADMIRFLQQHSEILARKNLKLTEEINKLKGVRQNGEGFDVTR